MDGRIDNVVVYDNELLVSFIVLHLMYFSQLKITVNKKKITLLFIKKIKNPKLIKTSKNIGGIFNTHHQN